MTSLLNRMWLNEIKETAQDRVVYLC